MMGFKGGFLLLLSIGLCSAHNGEVHSTSVDVNCFQAPNDASCTSFVVPADTLKTVLGKLCNDTAGEGWPAACTLWQECQTGNASSEYCTSPLGLLRSACSEVEVMYPVCSMYSTLCSADSVVEQCKNSPMVSQLGTGEDYYMAIRQACDGHYMPECDECASGGGGDTVVAMALEVQCPDPLRTLSAMCLDHWHSSCDGWNSFCVGAGNNTAFPELCDGGFEYRPAVEPSSSMNASTTEEESSMSDMSDTMQAPPSSSSQCYEDPTAAECMDFKQGDQDSIEQIESLCDDMSDMIGCTLWKECEEMRSGGGGGDGSSNAQCTPFSILSDICYEMSGMSGCDNYNKLCSAQGSVVKQCTEEGRISNVLTTSTTVDGILQMCSGHGMPACSQCTSYSNCPDPMSTMSALCLSMSGMSGCAQFDSFCQEAGDTFTSLCGQNSDSLPPMKMYLHASMRELILIKEWVPTSNGAYIASCIAVIATGVFVSALKATRVKLEKKWNRRVPGGGSKTTLHLEKPAGSSSSLDDSMAVQPLPLKKKLMAYMSFSQFKRNVVRSIITSVVVFFDYMLMLIVMTFNIGLIISAVLGFSIGMLMFGHVGETSTGAGSTAHMISTNRSGSAVAVQGNIAPDSENDLEVQFLEHSCPC